MKNKSIFSDSKWRKITFYCTKTNISALLIEITSEHVGDLYYLNCLHPYKTKTRLESQAK